MLVEINLNDVHYIPDGMTRAFRNTRYTVMIYDNHPTSKGPATRVMIQRHDDAPIPNHWSELQKIKNAIFGEDVTAVEYYPAVSDLIDGFNIYWLWIYPKDVLPIPIMK